VEAAIMRLNVELEEHVLQRDEKLEAANKGLKEEFTEREQADKALSASEGRYRSLFENMLNGYAYCKMLFEDDQPQDFIYVDVNPAFGALTGLNNIVGQKVTQVMPGIKESNPELFEIYGRVSLTGIPERFETYLPALGIWFSISVFSPAKGYFVAMFDNITEHKGAQKSLQRSEEKYRELVNEINDGIFIIDDYGIMTFANPALAKIYGFESTEELVGRNFTEFVSPTMANNIFEEFERGVETGKTAEMINSQIIRHDGSSAFIEIKPTYIIDGSKVIGARGVIRDITDRKKAEEKIREQAELLNKAQDAIIVRDLEDHILFCNEGTLRLYGVDGVVDEPGELNGKKLSDLLNKDDSQFEKAKKTTLEKGEWNGEFHQVTKDGKEVIVESHWSLIRDNMGNPKSILTINTDATEKKKLESQLFRAQRMESIGTLAGGIAHDLNNVLHPIVMALQLLSIKFTDEQSQSWLNSIETSAQRGANLVKQVLSFARGLEGEHTILQIRHLIVEIEKILGETFPKSIEIHTDIPKDLWIISGDPTQLHQVLMNLCVNARDAMPNGGRLSISAENILVDENYVQMNIDASVGAYTAISVSDTGTGIPPGIMDRIFEPFFTTKEPGKGTGLGLSTAFGIVKSHGGFIHVYSEVGRGTRFRVYLPAIETKEVKRAEEKRGELTRGHGELILVVDDEALIREVTRAILETHGYRVITANDGAEAVALYAQHREELGVVLMDMVMPIMDGPATIRALYKMDQQVKVIAVSGIKEDDKLTEVTGVDVRAFLTKPHATEVLLKTLNQVLSAK
jgi:PAS domain S-box-containing protein